MVTTRPLVVCMVGVMCASVAPPAEGFTPPGCFARVHTGAGDSFYCSERRLVVAASAASSSSSSCSSSSSSSSSPSPNPSRGSSLAARAGLCGGPLRGPAAAARERRRGSASSPQPLAGRRHSGGGGGAGRDRGGGGGGGRGVKMMSAAGGGRGGEGEVRHQRQQQHLQLQKQKQQQQQQQKKKRPSKKQQQQQQQLSMSEVADAPHALSDPFRRKQQQQQQQDSNNNANLNNSNNNNNNQQQQQQQEVEASLPSSPPPSTSSSSSSDPLALYFKTLRKFSQLNKDEEVVLGRKIQRGIRCERLRDRLEARDGVAPTYEEWAAALNLTREELYHELDTAEKAKRHMISANLRLVVSISRRYQFRGMSFPDLIQEGTMGLVKASEKFNPELGFKFCTYATWWIKQSLMTGIANQSRIIRLPASVHDFLNSVRKYTIELTVDGKLPTDQELGDKLGATVEKIQYYRRAAISTDSLSLDARVGGGILKSGDNSDSNLGDMVGDGVSPEDISQTTYMKGKVSALLETLDDREKRVVRSRYGLDGLDPKTLEQIGRDVGLTRERVRQIEVKALHKLRQPYRNYRLRDHGLEQLFVDAGVRQPASEAISAAKALIAKAESSAQGADSAYVEARLGVGAAKTTAAEPSSSQGSDSGFVETRVAVGAGAGAGDVERPSAALTVDQRALEIESKRKSLDKAWNKDSAAAVDRLERELEKSTAALVKLEREQEEWKLSTAAAVAVVGEKSLSMAS